MSNDELYNACIRGDLEKVKHLVEQGCDPKAKESFSIRLASARGHLDVVKYLVSVGCDPKARDNLAIQWASENGHLDVVKYLLELGYDHKEAKKEYKYEVLQDVKVRLLTLMYTIPNKYLKMEILKRIIPHFSEKQIINIIND